jgi:hypothetical protein
MYDYPWTWVFELAYTYKFTFHVAMSQPAHIHSEYKFAV